MSDFYYNNCYDCTREGFWNCKKELDEKGNCKNFSTEPQRIERRCLE